MTKEERLNKKLVRLKSELKQINPRYTRKIADKKSEIAITKKELKKLNSGYEERISYLEVQLKYQERLIRNLMKR